jgi:hypothetical protein
LLWFAPHAAGPSSRVIGAIVWLPAIKLLSALSDVVPLLVIPLVPRHVASTWLVTLNSSLEPVIVTRSEMAAKAAATPAPISNAATASRFRMTPLFLFQSRTVDQSKNTRKQRWRTVRARRVGVVQTAIAKWLM